MMMFIIFSLGQTDRHNHSRVRALPFKRLLHSNAAVMTWTRNLLITNTMHRAQRAVLNCAFTKEILNRFTTKKLYIQICRHLNFVPLTKVHFTKASYSKIKEQHLSYQKPTKLNSCQTSNKHECYCSFLR